MQRRTLILSGSITLVLLIVIAAVLCIPYKTTTASINRRTARHSAVVAYYAIPTERSGDKWSVISGRGKILVAPDINITTRIYTQRFPWSDVEETLMEEGHGLSKLYHALFVDLFTMQDQMTAEEYKEVFDQRLTFWNTTDLTRARTYLARINEENDVISHKSLLTK